LSLPLVIDDSVAVKWLFRESDQGLAQSLAGRFELIAPDLMLVECGNAIWRRNRLGEVSAAVAASLIATLRSGPIRYVSTEGLVEHAVALGVMLAHPIYDCIYLSLALAEDLAMVTSDRRFAQAVRTHHGLSGRLVLLQELAH